MVTSSIYFMILDLDPIDCRWGPCLHDGECIEEYKNYTCNCTHPYTGRHCAQGSPTVNTFIYCDSNFCSLHYQSCCKDAYYTNIQTSHVIHA